MDQTEPHRNSFHAVGTEVLLENFELQLRTDLDLNVLWNVKQVLWGADDTREDFLLLASGVLQNVLG